MSWERFGGLRAAIAQLAAQIMYGQEVKQYFTAKRLAAKRLLGAAGGKKLRYRPVDLPSNGEIKQALLELVIEIEGTERSRRLFAMRIVALEAMAPLAPFVPRLIGSVATGHVRSGSDIDLHVFADDASDVERHVQELGWTYEVQRVSIMKGGKAMEFTHLQVADLFPIELTVYKPRDLGTRPRSSTDGKPIVRISCGALRRLCEKDHAELWNAYVATGAVPTMEEILSVEDDTAPDDVFEDSRDPWEEASSLEPLGDGEVDPPRAGDDDDPNDDIDTNESREDDGFRGRRRVAPRCDGRAPFSSTLRATLSAPPAWRR